MESEPTTQKTGVTGGEHSVSSATVDTQIGLNLLPETPAPACSCKLKWITPEAENMIIDTAKVSSDNTTRGKALIRYLLANKHWSPFEMANVCIEIKTTRAISRQILRHRSFSFQEFSQRYQTIAILDEPIFSQARSQDLKNRQNSIDDVPTNLREEWQRRQAECWQKTNENYTWALSNGIAKEVARVILPEGNTPTRLYMNGNIRSWIHYCDLRAGNGTQLEHREVAIACREILKKELPTIAAAMGWK
jgi:thymidylate synthase (FAD)